MATFSRGDLGTGVPPPSGDFDKLSVRSGGIMKSLLAGTEHRTKV